jgi:polygalacturonase
MKDGHGGVVIGSEMSGSVRNIFVEDCLMDSPYLDRAIRVKTNSLRGGIVEKIYVRNLTIGEVREAVISVNFNYGEGDVGEFTPIVRDIYLDHIVSRKSKYAILLNGYERSPISNLMLENCTFNGVNDGNLLNHYVNLTLKNVYINGELQ